LIEDLRGRKVITIAFDDSATKTSFFLHLSRFLTGTLKQQTHFLDLDLQFSTYLQNAYPNPAFGLKENELLKVYQPDDRNPEDSFFKLFGDRGMLEKGAIIIDSINTLQNLLRQKELDSNSIRANQKSAILLTLIQQSARHYSKTVWISNMLRSRPRESVEGEVTWENELSGGRMLLAKSDAILSLKKNGDSIESQEAVKAQARGTCISLTPVRDFQEPRYDLLERSDASKWKALKDKYSICF